MNIEVFKFDKAELQVIQEQPGKIQVAMKPIVDALGLDWKSQHRNISEDPVLNSVMVIMTTTGADGKQYEMVCLPIDYLNGWLFKISANRYKGERRAVIIRYQRECYRVLADHFLPSRKQIAAEPNIEKVIKNEIGSVPFYDHVRWAMEEAILPTILEMIPPMLAAYDKSIQCRRCRYAVNAAADAVSRVFSEKVYDELAEIKAMLQSQAAENQKRKEKQ